ncbi:MAG: AmmeMemoRadiSam system protein A [Candidatus Brocadiales bacterium]|nr:AmmeMemoRadiSam system protein A [Candidatus Brocadiales bacterium]
MGDKDIEKEIERETSIHKKLLEIARSSIEAALKGGFIPDFRVTDPELYHHHGVFVTLKKHGQLRGCIGRFMSDIPLYQLVSEMAISAALEDPRFQFERLNPRELREIDIEISVLSPLRKISNPLDFELGKHGIYIRRGTLAGCFLPQVASESGWSKEEFLSYCCLGKAGLHPEAWREPSTEVYVFTTGVIEEHHHG